MKPDQIRLRVRRIRQSLDGVGYDGDTEAGLYGAVGEIVDLLEAVLAEQPTLNHPVPCQDCTYYEPCERARALEGTR